MLFFLFMVPQTVPMLTNNQLQVLQHGTMTKVRNSFLCLTHGQCNRIDKNLRDSTTPLPSSHALLRSRRHLCIFFFVMLKGGLASDNVGFQFPVSSKMSRRDKYRKKKKTLIALLTYFFFPPS